MYRNTVCTRSLSRTFSTKTRKRGQQTALQPEDIHARILYHDDRIVVYNKPSRHAVHGGPKVGKTILQQLDEANISPIYNVHRLDKDTTGVLLLARDKEMASFLSSLMRHHKILRSYLALCIGVPVQAKGEVGGVIGHYYKNNRHIMGMTQRLTNNSRDTLTKYKVVKSYSDALSMIELQPLTGAKHQLKVHCAQLLKTPIFGDLKYAPKALLRAELAQRYLKRGLGFQPLHLHSHKILLPDYKDTDDLVVQAPLPTHFLATLMRVESYDFHRTKSMSREYKDRTVDTVDEQNLRKLTGITARESMHEIDASVPEDETSVDEHLSYWEEQVYGKYDPGLKNQNIRTHNLFRHTLDTPRTKRRRRR